MSILLWMLLTSAWAADSLDARFLDGLRERRLFELAEQHCRERLQAAPQGSAAEAEVTQQLIRTLAMHAAQSPPESRGALWANARQTAAAFLRRSPPSPRAPLIRVQDALTPLAQGELARLEFESGSLRQDQLEPARQALREATNLLEALDKELVREIPLRRRTPPRGAELTADELFGLSQDVQHQLARAARNRALLAERNSDDRRALLLEAVAMLQRPLAQLAADEPLRPTLQLELAECQRLLGQLTEANESAAALDAAGSLPAVRLRARAELIRIALARRDMPAAERLLEQGRTIAGHGSAELDFAWFEASLALAGSANPPQAKRYQTQAAELAKSLEETYGPYWGRRADQLLVAALPKGGGNLELLSRKADSLYLKKEFDQAIAAYDEASAAAREAGNLTGAFDLAYKAALVDQQRGRNASAAQRLRILAKGLASHSGAPAAHLLAVWNAGQLVSRDSAAAELYAELLREHLAIWPAAESAAQVRIWLAAAAESRGDLAAAIAALSGVSRDSPQYPTAITALARFWHQRLAKLVAARQPTTEPAAEAIRTFSAALRGPKNALPELWTDADRTAAVAIAELIATYEPTRAAEAEQVLRAALAAGEPPAAWRTAAQAQLVVALAGQAGREAEAAELLRQISAASPPQLLAVLDGLSQVAARSQNTSRPAIATAQLIAVSLLEPHRQALSATEQLALSRVHAEALAAMGRRDEALVAYAQLAKANPDSGPIQEAYAALLLDSKDAAQLRQALDQWRLVASKSQPRSPRWQQAKYSVAKAQFKLGEPAAAATLLRFILETPPGLAGSEWEPRYRELLRQCER